MYSSLESCMPHIRPLPWEGSVTAFIILSGVRKRLEMLSEVLEMADAHEEPLRCLGVLAGIMESQIVELERVCGRLCPNFDEE